MNYYYKFRLYPNRKQQIKITHTFGCCRFVYNRYLSMRKSVYEQNRELLDYRACIKNLNSLLKSEDARWLCDVDKSALRSAVWDVNDACQHMMKKAKPGTTPKYPRPKKKRSRRQTYRSSGPIEVLDNAIVLPELGKVKCRISKEVQGSILSATLSLTSGGKYFLSLCCRLSQGFDSLPSTGENIGLAAAHNSFAVLSNGLSCPYPKHLIESELLLARHKRQLARKTKGSANWKKAMVQFMTLKEHVLHQRMDFMQKLSTDIIRQYDVICMKDSLKRFLRDVHNRNMDLSYLCWGEFKWQIFYKSCWYGKTLSAVVESYPEKQICSHCGNRCENAIKPFSNLWKCPNCGSVLSREHNAAVNILNEGLSILA